MMRRELLAAAPAALIPFPALAGFAPDPAFALYEEWKAARSAWIASLHWSPSGNYEEPECIAAEAHCQAVVAQMLECQPQTPEAIAAMLHVFWEEWCPYSGEKNVDLSAEQGGWHFFAHIWGAASGRSGLPPEITVH